jgi:hypothetical protein
MLKTHCSKPAAAQGSRLDRRPWWLRAREALGLELWALGFGLWALGLAAQPHAMVVVPAAFGEMVTSSQIIVHGRVTAVQAYETAGRRTIETLVTVQVEDAYKGGPSQTVYFRVPGGQVGRYRRVMVAAPAFARGDEIVLFLKGRPPAVPMPFGLTQGVYRVVRGGNGIAMVTPLVNEGSGRVVRGDPARRPLDLATFATRVRALVAARP